MINKVTKKECFDAIEFLHGMGFVEQMSGDERYYTEILMKRVANIYGIKLEGIDEK